MYKSCKINRFLFIFLKKRKKLDVNTFKLRRNTSIPERNASGAFGEIGRVFPERQGRTLAIGARLLAPGARSFPGWGRHEFRETQ